MTRDGASGSQDARRSLGVALGVLAVFLLALALRTGHLAALRAAWSELHLFAVARGDAAHHWHEAHAILGGDPWLTEHVLWKGPGYSYFLAGLIALFGNSPGTLRWPLAVLGALNCAGLVLLARRVLPGGWSIAAGGLAAVNGVLILYDGELFFPTLLISLSLAALWLVTRPVAGTGSHVAAGCLTGAAVLVHPVYLVPAGTLTLWIARRGLGRASAFVLAVAALIAPVSLTNVFVRGQPLLVSWNGGINVYVGNQRCFDQVSGNRTNAWRRILETPIDAGLEQEYERDRFYYGLAARQALQAPIRALALLAQKTLILFSPVEYASNVRLYELRDYSPVLAAGFGRWGPLWWPFGLLAPLALIGIGLMLRERAALAGALGMWSLGLAATIVLSFNTSRYRAPLVFFGCVWAAYSLARGWTLWRNHRRPQLAAGAAIALGLAVAIGLLAEPQRGYPLPLEWEESVALSSLGQPDRAEVWVLRALERAPEDAPLKLAASEHFRRRGRLGEEREQLQRMLALPDLEPDLISIGRHHLAKSWAAEGNIEQARRQIELALAVDVDETTWRGHEYYRLGLGPLTACRLQLDAAGFEFDAGEPSRGVELLDRARAACPTEGRLKTKLDELAARAIVAVPRLE